MAGRIVIHGARVHNLKNIDLEIPRDALVVITGVSGSGKSSLAFDTLYAEGQRRYLESLGGDGRQLLKQLAKPDVDLIDGLSPAIAIQQRAAPSHPRSTVGTVTDVYDFLRVLFARVGKPFCVQCGAEINAQTIDQMVDRLLALPAQTRIVVLAPLALSAGAGLRRTFDELQRQGFTRLMVDGQLRELVDGIADEVRSANEIDLVVDRLSVRQDISRRLTESLEVASRAGQQIVKILAAAEGESVPAQPLLLTQKAICLRCGAAAPEISPGLFSFNSPQGACSGCDGLGVVSRRGKRGRQVDDDRQACTDCAGSRLNKAGLSVQIAGKNISELSSMSVAESLAFCAGLELPGTGKIVAHDILAEITGRLACMARLGLDYLSLDRPSNSLSGGEAQRVRLATQIGAGLAGVLYILDEPSIGLHQKDNGRLIALLKELRDAGNSVIVVEHDPETILAADYVVDMGPGAGLQGGAVVARGTPLELRRDTASLTGRYLSASEVIPLPLKRRAGAARFIRLKHARARNLKDLTVEFPIGAMTCVTGVSGAGKSTLVMEVLYQAIRRRLEHGVGKFAGATEITGCESIDRVFAIDQLPIGRTPRSNPATYTGLYDHLRELFAQLPDARARGYKAERFSFNLRGGRCEACEGDGVTRLEMYFLPDIYVPCEACRGRRYNRETLEIKYKGLSIADVLDLTVTQGLELLGNIPLIHDRLRTLFDVGVGYLRLGQPASTLSGGEAQRVKLARELARKSTGNALYILDEPTTGLHFDDVKKLLDLLGRLIDLGNTTVIVEHNLEVIKCADYLLDLGPEGGPKGGEIIAKGTPEEVSENAQSSTGSYLKAALRSGRNR